MDGLHVARALHRRLALVAQSVAAPRGPRAYRAAGGGWFFCNRSDRHVRRSLDAGARDAYDIGI